MANDSCTRGARRILSVVFGSIIHNDHQVDVGNRPRGANSRCDTILFILRGDNYGNSLVNLGHVNSL